MVDRLSQNHSEIASDELDAIIQSEQESDELDLNNFILVDEARDENRQAVSENTRSRARVLFITNDTSFLNPADAMLDRFFDLENEFDEIHIMVLMSGTIPTKPVLRVRSRVWVYIASAKQWWKTPHVAKNAVASEQLVFASGFRPDIIVSLEPFESGLAALWIGKKYDRPVQIHVRRNFLTRKWRKESSRNKWRSLIARHVLGKAKSIRYTSLQIRQSITPLCNKDANVELLPRFNNFRHIISHKPAFDVHDKYPAYEKILLYIGALQYDSTFFSALDVIKFILANPRVGLVVVGDGPIRKDCEKKIKKLGVETQVVFAKAVEDIATYMKTADCLFVSDQNALADEIVLQAAVACLPTIMIETELRREYFVDTENAYICPSDLNCFREKLNSIVHDSDVRKKFREQIKKTVQPRLIEDAKVYHERYRATVEKVVVDVSDEDPLDL